MALTEDDVGGISWKGAVVVPREAETDGHYGFYGCRHSHGAGKYYYLKIKWLGIKDSEVQSSSSI